MNKQVGYITQAHLLLAGLAATFWFVSKFSSATSDNNDNTTVTKNLIETKTVPPEIKAGKNLFMNKCAACHSVLKVVQGPQLGRALESDQWADRKRLYEWIRNPEAFMKKDFYTRELRKMYGATMQAFPSLSDQEIDAIVNYINWQNQQSNLPAPVIK